MNDFESNLPRLSRNELIDLVLKLNETIQSLRQTVVRQEEIIKQQGEVIKKQDEKIAKLENEILLLKEARKEGGEPPASSSSSPERKIPDWVKPNARKRETEQPKNKRKAREINQTYRRLQANKIKEHRYDCCPDSCQFNQERNTAADRSLRSFFPRKSRIMSSISNTADAVARRWSFP